MGYRLFCRRKGPGGDYCVTVRSGKLCLALPNNNDLSQIWEKVEKSGCSGFMLINKATNMAVRYCGVGDQLFLVDMPRHYEESVFWTETGDMGNGFRSFRPLSNDGLGMDAWCGHIFDGTLVSVYPSKNLSEIGENAQWKLVPIPKPDAPVAAPKTNPAPALSRVPSPKTPAAQAPAPAPVFEGPSNVIYCLAGDAQYCVGVQAGKIVLVKPNPKDLTQHWYMDNKWRVYAAGFMLVNKATGQVARQESPDQPLQLVSRPISPDGPVLWTVNRDDDYGFKSTVTANCGFAMSAGNGNGKRVHDGICLTHS